MAPEVDNEGGKKPVDDDESDKQDEKHPSVEKNDESDKQDENSSEIQGLEKNDTAKNMKSRTKKKKKTSTEKDSNKRENDDEKPSTDEEEEPVRTKLKKPRDKTKQPRITEFCTPKGSGQGNTQATPTSSKKSGEKPADDEHEEIEFVFTFFISICANIL